MKEGQLGIKSEGMTRAGRGQSRVSWREGGGCDMVGRAGKTHGGCVSRVLSEEKSRTESW